MSSVPHEIAGPNSTAAAISATFADRCSGHVERYPSPADRRQDQLVRYSTAVQRLHTIAAEASRIPNWDGDKAPAGLVALYVFGELLDAPEALDVVRVALVMELPEVELPWCPAPTSQMNLAHWLRLDKAPVYWVCRPASRPVANHEVIRPVRFWSAADGADEEALTALKERRADPLRLPAVAPAALRDQVAAEIVVAFDRLRRIEAEYWESRWRRRHRGDGYYPEHYLWDATHGYVSLRQALEDLGD
jgi:hypothetical protein